MTLEVVVTGCARRIGLQKMARFGRVGEWDSHLSVAMT